MRRTLGHKLKAIAARFDGKAVFGFIRTTLVGGLVFVAPLVVLVLVIAKLAGFLRRLAEPLAARMPDTILGTLAADVIMVVLLVLACFFAGFLAHWGLARRFLKKAEVGVLWRIPGYGLAKGLTDSLDKSASETSSMPPVLIHFDDSAQLAFEVDTLPDGRRVIYVPGAPDPRSGSVMVMAAERVEALPMTYLATLGTLRALGRGLGKKAGLEAKVPDRPDLRQ